MTAALLLSSGWQPGLCGGGDGGGGGINSDSSKVEKIEERGCEWTHDCNEKYRSVVIFTCIICNGNLTCTTGPKLKFEAVIKIQCKICNNSNTLII